MAGAGAAVWRLRVGRSAPAAVPNSTSTARPLTLATLLASFVVITVIAGFALAIAVHIPDFVLSNAAP